MKRLTAEKINDNFQYCYAVFVGDKKLTLPLSESDAKKIADRYNGFEDLEQENKRLAMQVEVLSADFENSREREKDLMDEREELVETLVEARLQIEYLEGKFGKTGTGTAAISRIERLTGKYKI